MKINKNLGYAINWLNHLNKSNEQIAKELDLTPKQVKSFLEKNHTNDSKSELVTKQSPVTINSSDLMIRHTRDKKINNVAIMTKEASAINDELRKINLSKASTRNQDCIYRPKK
jgi:predicted transcriptional regulator